MWKWATGGNLSHPGKCGAKDVTLVRRLAVAVPGVIGAPSVVLLGGTLALGASMDRTWDKGIGEATETKR